MLRCAYGKDRVETEHREKFDVRCKLGQGLTLVYYIDKKSFSFLMKFNILVTAACNWQLDSLVSEIVSFEESTCFEMLTHTRYISVGPFSNW